MSKKRSLVSYPKIILAFVLLIILSVSVSAWVDVVDNTASGESCKDFCGHLNGICMDVGIDTDGTNDQICDQ